MCTHTCGLLTYYMPAKAVTRNMFRGCFSRPFPSFSFPILPSKSPLFQSTRTRSGPSISGRGFGGTLLHSPVGKNDICSHQSDQTLTLSSEIVSRSAVNAFFGLGLYLEPRERVRWLQPAKCHSVSVKENVTRCSAIAERPRCRVRYSFRQK